MSQVGGIKSVTQSARLKFSDATAKHAARVMRAVAHPMRLRIIAMLCEREATVTELTSALRAPQAIVSQQLRGLRTRGLVKARRRWPYTYYSVAEANLRSLVCCIRNCRRRKS